MHRYKQRGRVWLDDFHEAFSVHLHNAVVGHASCSPFKDLLIAGVMLVAMIHTYDLIGPARAATSQ